MDVDLAFPSRYMKAADLKSRDVTLTIRRAIRQEVVGVNGQAEMKWLLYFEETRASNVKAGKPDEDEKRYIFRGTFARQVAAALGERDMDKWPGRKITLYATNEKGKDCIRCRPSAPGTESAPVTASPEPGAQ